MNVIWKFPIALPTDHVMAIEMPTRSQILSLQLQKGIPTIWARHPRLATPTYERRFFRWIATGEDFADVTISSDATQKSDLTYVATLQFHEGSLVFHLFEEVMS